MAELTDEQAKLFLDRNLGVVATIRRDGTPQLTTTWIDWDGEHVLFNTAEGRAKPRNILAQFVVEALTLSVTGGVIGVVLGLLAAHRLASQFGWPMLIRPDTIAIAVGFSAVVGVAFGLYPARKASRLDPIQALRFE